jgi:hypothetical protein
VTVLVGVRVGTDVNVSVGVAVNVAVATSVFVGTPVGPRVNVAVGIATVGTGVAVHANTTTVGNRVEVAGGILVGTALGSTAGVNVSVGTRVGGIVHVRVGVGTNRLVDVRVDVGIALVAVANRAGVRLTGKVAVATLVAVAGTSVVATVGIGGAGDGLTAVAGTVTLALTAAGVCVETGVMDAVKLARGVMVLRTVGLAVEIVTIYATSNGVPVFWAKRVPSSGSTATNVTTCDGLGIRLIVAPIGLHRPFDRTNHIPL